MYSLWLQFRWTWLPIGCWHTKKVLTNHIPHATYIPALLFLRKYYKMILICLIFLGIILFLQIKDCESKKEKYDTYTTEGEVETTDTSQKPSAKTTPKPKVKKPLFGFGESTSEKIVLEDTSKPTGKPRMKVEVLGDDFKVRVPKGLPVAVTIHKEPLIRLIPRRPFYFGIMGTWYDDKFQWGINLKFQPLEIYKFGANVWVSNKGYGFGVAYKFHKSWSLDGLFEYRTKVLWLGVGRKL